ncbi:MAG: hypothetical protein K9K33_17330, partial [Desulfarculaceae bacterium]|nr:hypothetical protein [Desulfarculaceae bacterium]
IVDDGGRPEAAAVISRLEDPEHHRLLSRLSQDGLSLDPERAAQQARALAAKVRQVQNRDQGRELTRQIAEAQRLGDHEQVAKLQAQHRKMIDISSPEPSRKD